ncbi:MAG: biotin--[acetyl-CoA-carboxylase] ligase [Prolixibacteraceae bacterium]|nr:biotin--[acetyl-CoA-carboxylase] ligase [Prolixibacteraceae bacterium]
MNQNNKKIIVVSEVESTNNYANRLILSEAAEDGTVVLAHYQTRGKGQLGNSWESEPDKNLLMSLIWFPKFLPATQQFLISKVVSLAITDVIQNYVEDCTIKWPNDIYIGNKKLAGILIENSVKGSNLFTSIIGIGMNINQEQFISDAPNPVSLKQVTGNSYEISVVLEEILKRLDFWYKKLMNKNLQEIDETYFSRLYRSKQWSLFSEPGKSPFEGRITGIGKFGQLQLQLRDKTMHEYMFKEIEFVM